MAYTEVSFVFGEQPSAAKWNLLGSNDAYFATIVGSAGSFNVGSGDSFPRFSNWRHQADLTNSSQSNVLIQSGWGWKLGTGANSMSETVTYPTAFATILTVIPSTLGVNTAADPTTIADFTTAFGTNVVVAHAISIGASSFTMALTLDSGALLGGSNRYGYSWLAIGTKT